MRVPEAVEALMNLHYVPLLPHRRRDSIVRILDKVWIEAYEEGLNRTFEVPEASGEPLKPSRET